jgi:hypothetical protein
VRSRSSLFEYGDKKHVLMTLAGGSGSEE